MVYLTLRLEKHRPTRKYEVLHSFVLLVKHYYVSEEDDDDKLSKITCKHCNGFVRWAGKSGELIYLTFIHEVRYTLEFYSKERVPENVFSQWPGRTKMNHL